MILNFSIYRTNIYKEDNNSISVWYGTIDMVNFANILIVALFIEYVAIYFGVAG